LTKRSLYILVADNRKEDTDFYYWLNVVELLGAGSPVIVVKNQKEGRVREIDEGRLRARFPNITAIVDCNFLSGEGFKGLVAHIKHNISQLPHMGTALPASWVKVRQSLDASPENYIQFTQYARMCSKFGFETQSEKLRLVDYLHDLGVCLHFSND